MNACCLIPVVFRESDHLLTQFERNNQRFRFIENLHLSVPIDLIDTTQVAPVLQYWVTQVPENRTEPEILTRWARFLQEVCPQLKEFHTRAQRRMFKQAFSNLASVKLSISDIIYKELTLDASAA